MLANKPSYWQSNAFSSAIFEVDTQPAVLMEVCGLPAVVIIVEMWAALSGHLLPAVRTEKHVHVGTAFSSQV